MKKYTRERFNFVLNPLQTKHLLMALKAAIQVELKEDTIDENYLNTMCQLRNRLEKQTN
jgi:hypothetical protein